MVFLESLWTDVRDPPPINRELQTAWVEASKNFPKGSTSPSRYRANGVASGRMSKDLSIPSCSKIPLWRSREDALFSRHGACKTQKRDFEILARF